jgi:heat shock protein HtpX
MQTLKVFGMMAGLTVLLVAIGSYFGGANGAVLFFVMAAVMNFGMYWFSDRAVLRMYGARTIGPEDAPDLYRMIDRLRQKAGLPMPTVAVAPSEQPNAFATGRSPEHAVVCVTVGILRLLPPRELEGVLAHELAHVRHRHMLVGTMAATLAGAVAMLGSVARWGMILGGFGGRDDREGGALGVLLMAIVAPIAAMIVQMAISRQNEFQADATGARITGDPTGLASALEHIEGYAKRVPMRVNPAAAQLAIINPLSGGRQAFVGLFRTHPSTEERVARLRGMQM